MFMQAKEMDTLFYLTTLQLIVYQLQLIVMIIGVTKVDR